MVSKTFEIKISTSKLHQTLLNQECKSLKHDIPELLQAMTVAP